MNRSGIGVGSASIILVFAVLCLTIFSLISFVVASNERNLVNARVSLVTNYYAADALAEQIVSDIFATDTIPDSVRGVDIYTGWNDELDAPTVYFFCHITDIKVLYVNLTVNEESFDVQSWRIYGTDEWEFDDSINVWIGDFD